MKIIMFCIEKFGRKRSFNPVNDLTYKFALGYIFSQIASQQFMVNIEWYKLSNICLQLIVFYYPRLFT